MATLLLNTACSAAQTPTERTHQSVILGDQRFKVEILPDTRAMIPDYGPRFDLTAHVKQVSLDQQTFLTSDGLIDEFGISGVGTLGYDQAKPREPFLKIGVGLVQRLDDKPYQFWTKYPVTKLAEQSPPRIEQNAVTFQQVAALGDYAYHYVKSYRVNTDKQRLVISYQITNTGKLTMRFDQYNHDWSVLADPPVGADYSLAADFQIPAPNASWLKLENNRLLLTQTIAKPGYQPFDCRVPADQNRLVLRNDRTGKTIEISGDFRITRFALYAQPDAICPEIFFTAELKPGQTASWNRTYSFRK
ncbi:MAG: hypothetical protein ACYC26_17695 [Phycisphaerales bacterium]